MKMFGLALSEGTHVKNLVMPLCTYDQLLNLESPDKGEIVYVTDRYVGMHIYDGANWTFVDVDYTPPVYTGDVSSNGSTLTLSATGVTPGSYTKVTTDNKGRITDGSNPTTLSGYGITNAVSITDNLLPLDNSSITSSIFDIAAIGTYIIDSTSTDYRSIKYIIQISADNSTRYQTIEIMLIHDDTNVYVNINQGSSTDGDLGAYDAYIENGIIQLTFIPVYDTNTLNIFKIQMGK